MGQPFIALEKSKKKHKEHLRPKKCYFPGCKETFYGTGKSKFCMEHRKRKYRKVIDAGKSERKKKEEELLSFNQIIKHDYKENTLVELTCQLEGCGNTFEVKLSDGIYVYPKFCSEHRNEYRRTIFLKQLG